MKIKKILLLIQLFIAISCNIEKSYVFPVIVEPEAEVMQLEHTHEIWFMNNTKDYLLLSGTDSIKNMLHIYSLPDFKYLRSCLSKGRAANEVYKTPNFALSDSNNENKVFLNGLKPATLTGMNISEEGDLKTVSNIKLRRDEAYNCMFLMNDRYFISIVDMQVVKYDIHSKKELDKIDFRTDGNGSFDPGFGFIASTKNHIVYGYCNKKQIDIYGMEDFKLKKLIRTKGNPNSDTQYYDVIAGKNHFYAVCAGDEYVEGEMITSKIEVYDYEGNPVKLYNLKKPATRILIDENNGYIYGHKQAERDYFLKYKL